MPNKTKTTGKKATTRTETEQLDLFENRHTRVVLSLEPGQTITISSNRSAKESVVTHAATTAENATTTKEQPTTGNLSEQLAHVLRESLRRLDQRALREAITKATPDGENLQRLSMIVHGRLYHAAHSGFRNHRKTTSTTTAKP